MAGSIGYEQGHHKVTQACGERVPFPAVSGTAADDLHLHLPAEVTISS
jgi:hypothetical protein